MILLPPTLGNFVGQPRIRTAPDPGSGGNGGGVPAAFRPESYANVKVDPNSGYNPMAYAARVWKNATRSGASQSYMRPYMYGYGSPYVRYPTGYVGGPNTVGIDRGLGLMYAGGLLAAAGLGLLIGTTFWGNGNFWS
jgi:hypothetical protein